MIKITLILLASILLSSAAPQPAAPVARPSTVEIHAVVYGTFPSGVTGPIGEYTAYGSSLGEATTNAQLLEEQIRTTATAQATR